MSVIEVKNISKKYKILSRRDGYLSFRDKIWQLLKSKKNVFKKNLKNDFFALNDVSFDVQKGDILGVIGENGSGKSTLLKIISSVVYPTKGQITIEGRITSMLEVGTGFHPELSGRENIFLNGAILGISKKDILKNFHKIVEFSGLRDFLDTPVKHYSSGMYTRLAFSVASHLNSDILLIDEVLAVGDIEFQRKSLQKMGEITKIDNKTIIFVSHNLQAVQNLCNKCMLLDKGKVKMVGGPKEVVQEYIKNKNSKDSIDLSKSSYENRDFQLLSFKLENGVNESFSVYWNSPIEIKIEILTKIDINYLSFVVGIETLEGLMIYNSWDVDYIKEKFSFQKLKKYEIKLRINHNLSIGSYNIAFSVLGGDKIYENYNQAVLEVLKGDKDNYPHKNKGLVRFETTWNKKEI